MGLRPIIPLFAQRANRADPFGALGGPNATKSLQIGECRHMLVNQGCKHLIKIITPEFEECEI